MKIKPDSAHHIALTALKVSEELSRDELIRQCLRYSSGFTKENFFNAVNDLLTNELVLTYGNKPVRYVITKKGIKTITPPKKRAPRKIVKDIERYTPAIFNPESARPGCLDYKKYPSLINGVRVAF